MAIEIEEIIDKIYSKIHHFLIAKVGEELEQDIIDIDIELKNETEVVLEIQLYIELNSFSLEDVQKLAEEAIQSGIQTADKVCPAFVIKVQQS
ncbi:MAG: hypothetical protein ACXACU_05335 [Candidatus Hodarchaeales archaeon]|jgi:hypothetical protein